jgi:MOB kinase activator 1
MPFLVGGGKTFKPAKKAVPGSRRFDLHKHAEATLGAGNLSEAVRLPPGENLNDWLAVNVTDFYNEISLLYGVLMDVCTPVSCPSMTAGPKFEYKWADGVKIRKPIKCSAPKYVDYMMTWVQTTLDDETMCGASSHREHLWSLQHSVSPWRRFPVRVGEPFPPTIRDTMCTMFKRLFRVYAHMYLHHFDDLRDMGAEPHLNTCFRHFVLFVLEFDLIDSRVRLAPRPGAPPRRPPAVTRSRRPAPRAGARAFARPHRQARPARELA